MRAPQSTGRIRSTVTGGRLWWAPQAVMAPLVNLVNSVLWKIEEDESPRSLRLAVAEATEEFKRQMRQHALNIAEGALGLIEEGSKIVTLSNSSTIHHALIHAQRAGRHPTVICAESLPGKEGRDHHRFAFTMWMTGGGIQPGRNLGETDELGFNITSDPYHVHDLQATILHCLGLDHTRLTYRHQGRDFRLTDVGGEIINPLLS